VPLPPVSQEGDDYEVVPNSKFYVSRTANRDNSSAYHVNGKKATFKDVGTLLRSHGIDLDHNRFLILQVIDYFVVFACSTFVFVLILPSPPARCHIVCCSGFLWPSGNPFSPHECRVANSKPCLSVMLERRAGCRTPHALRLL